MPEAKPLTPAEQTVWSAYHDADLIGGDGVTRTDWRRYYCGDIVGTQRESMTKSFNRAVAALVSKGHVFEDAGVFRSLF